MEPLQQGFYPNVQMGQDCSIGDFVVLGVPPKGVEPGELPLSIGQGAVIRSHGVIYAGSRIGERFQTGHGALIRESCTIGDDCSVGSGSILEFNVRLGNRVRLHSHVFVPEFSILEDGCWLGPNVVLTNAKFPLSKQAKETLAGVSVCRNAKVGANCTILPGVVIGEGALVGAGTVVTKNVPPGTVVIGNPGRVVGKVGHLQYPGTDLPVYGENEA